MEGAQWVEVRLARGPAWQVRQGYLLRYQFEIGRTFPRNCEATL